jgi:hypothetical protein
VDPVGLEDVFLKEIRLMGYEVQILSLAPAQNGNEKKAQVFYGSGFFISEDGLFITAYHVIEQAETIILRKANGSLFRARILIEDPVNDIAILSTIGEQEEDYWLHLGNSHSINIGDRIRVIGYPVPNLVGPKPKLAAGFISLDAGIRGDPTRFEIRAPLNLGYSGAAIVNTHNEVIGITSEQANAEWFFLGRTGPLPPDINFGVKINYARMLLEICLGEEVLRKGPKSTSLEDKINSTALVLVNTQDVPADFQSKRPDRIILVELSRAYFYYILQYTIFEFNKRWAEVFGEVLATGYIGGAPTSNPTEIFEAFIKEMRIKAML